jgi:hypothetical protein
MPNTAVSSKTNEFLTNQETYMCCVCEDTWLEQQSGPRYESGSDVKINSLPSVVLLGVWRNGVRIPSTSRKMR